MSRIRFLRAPPSNVHQTRTRPSQLPRTRSAPCKLRFARFGACTWTWVPGRYLHRGLMECIWPNKHRGTWIGRGEVPVPHSPMSVYGTLVTDYDRGLCQDSREGKNRLPERRDLPLTARAWACLRVESGLGALLASETGLCCRRHRGRYVSFGRMA